MLIARVRRRSTEAAPPLRPPMAMAGITSARVRTLHERGCCWWAEVRWCHFCVTCWTFQLRVITISAGSWPSHWPSSGHCGHCPSGGQGYCACSAESSLSPVTSVSPVQLLSLLALLLSSGRCQVCSRKLITVSVVSAAINTSLSDHNAVSWCHSGLCVTGLSGHWPLPPCSRGQRLVHSQARQPGSSTATESVISLQSHWVIR